jgi:hypothetical protein
VWWGREMSLVVTWKVMMVISIVTATFLLGSLLHQEQQSHCQRGFPSPDEFKPSIGLTPVQWPDQKSRLKPSRCCQPSSGNSFGLGVDRWPVMSFRLKGATFVWRLRKRLTLSPWSRRREQACNPEGLQPSLVATRGAGLGEARTVHCRAERQRELETLPDIVGPLGNQPWGPPSL